jgi:hypothetical protein
MLSRLPAIDLIGASELLSSYAQHSHEPLPGDTLLFAQFLLRSAITSS